MLADAPSMVQPVLLSMVPLAVVALLALVPYRRRLFVALMMLPRDIRFIFRYLKVVGISQVFRKRNVSVVGIFRQNLARHPNKTCFIFEGNKWTFADVEKYSNKVARAFQKEGFRKGDAVALMMENRPEFVCIWLGLAKLGVVTAFVNTNLRHAPLGHSLQAASCRAAICSPALVSALLDVDSELPLFVLDEVAAAGARALEPLLGEQDPLPPQGVPTPGNRDPLLYIYTSGTTGLPKAAVMLHSRFLLICLATKHMLALRDDDIIYTPLPQYHTAGGVVGAGAAIYSGLTVVMRPKFSASAYFSDCVRHGCTVGQYIGEICRYLLAVPPRAEDTQHRLRLLVGNGMRPQIWKTFVERFQVPAIRELYGATEGNTNVVNLDSTVGAIGFVPRFLPVSALPLALVRVDEASGLPVRGPDGFLQRCDIDEPGMCVGDINPKSDIREFHGYVNKQESEKKVMYDAFKKGDQVFLSGDILVMDEYGYLFFKDRKGDTFRWKGENVSTAEVEAVISNVIDLKDASVYGVEVPGTEGRAGMVAVQDPEGSLDLERLAAGLQRSLPTYARPYFLRVTPRIELTGTFKIKKTTLQKEGFDPALVPSSDRLYLLLDGVYRPLTADLHQKIVDGLVRL